MMSNNILAMIAGASITAGVLLVFFDLQDSGRVGGANPGSPSTTPRILATCPAQGLLFNDGKVRVVRAVLYDNGMQGWQECEVNPYRDSLNKAQADKRQEIEAEAQRNAILEVKRATKSTVPSISAQTNMNNNAASR